MLAAARATYTEKHPESCACRTSSRRRVRKPLPNAGGPRRTARAQLQSDPTYRQLVADREMARLRISDLSRADKDIRRQIST